MKNNTVKKIRQLAATALITITACSTAFAGTWQNDISGWHYLQDDGSYAAGGWLNDGGTYYWMDAAGNMKTGWIQDVNGNLYYMNTALDGVEGAMHTGWLNLNGLWYFFDTTAGEALGSLKTGWQWIDGYCYYFDPLLGGAMAAGTITADGSLVDADGRWIAADGTPYYETGKGLSSTASVTSYSSGSHVSSGSSAGSGGSSSGSSSRSGSSSSSASITSSGGALSYGESSSKYDIDEYYKTQNADGINDFTKGNWNLMTAAQQEAMEEAIEEFKDKYITSGMSDFEKEMTIIQWICENCSYETGDDIDYTGYSCIVRGLANACGYADGFLQMGKACGLTVRYVYNNSTTWNLIELDGDWYHVDLNFEDATGCGFDHLVNQYINLEDSKIRVDPYHYVWTPDTIACNGTAYGPNTVTEYLKSGTVDTSLGTSYTEEEQEFFDKFNGTDSFVLTYSNVDSTVNEIVDFLSGQIEARKSVGNVLLYFPDSYTSSKTNDYLEVSNTLYDIRDRVSEKINAKYGDVLRSDIAFGLILNGSSDGHFYAFGYQHLYYIETAVSVDYTIHYVDHKNNEVGVQSGTADKGEYVYLDIPEGYEVMYTSKVTCVIRSGSFNYDGERILINGTDEIDFDIPVNATTDNTSAISTFRTTVDEPEDTADEKAKETISENDDEETAAKGGEETAAENAEETNGTQKNLLNEDIQVETREAAETEDGLEEETGEESRNFLEK